MVNTGAGPLPLSELSVRYWYTNEAASAQQFHVDWAAIGASSISGSFVGPDVLYEGADSYLAVAFQAGAPILAPNQSTGEIQLRINPADWSSYDESDDYSFSTVPGYNPQPKITVYRNGILVWGKEPIPAYCNGGDYRLGTVLSVNYSPRDPGQPSDNQLMPQLTLVNTGGDPVTLSDVTVRYWYTKEGSAPMSAWVDYAALGSANVTVQSTAMPTSAPGANNYVAVGFTAAGGDLPAGMSTGPIQLRLHKQDWSPFSESDDYSYGPTGGNAWKKVGVYYRGALIFGIEP
jgi:hypothetical protein